ncbi:UDP-glycosyltransferase 73C3-like [Nicotiana tabacum]|uniref:UDP-glycosyltransferase 73C3-like n=1 Tax=Nicotiana tabacum TaxID=4097 RepID=A0AC58SMX3_TOBAC
MISQDKQLHFLLIPLMSQSHIIPLTDFAKLLAQHGINVSIITTPLNAQRYKSLITQSLKFNLKIQLIPLHFPCEELGLPKGCENMDSLPSTNLYKEFFLACETLKKPLEKIIQKLETKPSCIVSTGGLSWTQEIADKFKIPRYVFQTISCFALLCSQEIETRNSQLPNETTTKQSDDVQSVVHQIKWSQNLARGTLINTFDELEPFYVDEYKKIMKNVFCVGPVSLCNKKVDEIINRGNEGSVDNEHSYLTWLNSMKPKSVVYVSFGSLCHMSFLQIKEIGLGLESSNVPFVWIIRGLNVSSEVKKWLSDENFEEKVKGRGIIIKGWAPQLMILSHPSVGGFLTHCGWNSTLEGITCGVPMITFPMFADQFYNEKLIVDVLKIGIRVGIEEKNKVLVKKEEVKKAINQLMNEGFESKERRKRTKELAIMSKEAMQESGSSYLNIKLLIQDVMQLVNN